MVCVICHLPHILIAEEECFPGWGRQPLWDSSCPDSLDLAWEFLPEHNFPQLVGSPHPKQ